MNFNCFFLSVLLPWMASAFSGRTGRLRPPISSSFGLHQRSFLTSPLRSSVQTRSRAPEIVTTAVNDQVLLYNGVVMESKKTSSSWFEELCDSLQAEPRGFLRIDENCEGERGVYLNRPVKAGETILSIPLEACLCDDDPPVWMMTETSRDVSYNSHPSDWAVRLAASLLERQLSNSNDLWLDHMPDPLLLRASLPIHWSEDVLQAAQSTALELAVDTAYFAREQAILDLMEGLEQRKPSSTNNMDPMQLRRLCENALDLVQTRSCRVWSHATMDDAAAGQPLRILAPVFDFINHHPFQTNAEFELHPRQRVIVRALKDIAADEQVLLHYGDSARPAWKCLVSYGFVPEYDSSAVDRDDRDEDEFLAEVYLEGKRYEVGPTTIPEAMVQHMSAMMGNMPPSMSSRQGPADDLDQNGGEYVEQDLLFTPDIAIRLARRISDAAFQMLSDPAIPDSDDEHETVEDVISHQLAAALRHNQHRVLFTCAVGLRDWAQEQQQEQP